MRQVGFGLDCVERCYSERIFLIHVHILGSPQAAAGVYEDCPVGIGFGVWHLADEADSFGLTNGRRCF